MALSWVRLYGRITTGTVVPASCKIINTVLCVHMSCWHFVRAVSMLCLHDDILCLHDGILCMNIGMLCMNIDIVHEH